MPDANTLSSELRKALLKQPVTTPGLKHSASLLAPWRLPVVGAGMTAGAAWEILKMLGRSGAAIGNALIPMLPHEVVLRGMSGESIVPPDAEDRLKQAADAALLGLPSKMYRAADASVAEMSKGKLTPPTPQDFLLAAIRGPVDVVAQDILPGREAGEILSGQTAEGQPLTSWQLGKDIALGALKAAGLKATIAPGANFGALKRATAEVPGVEKVWSVGEMANAAEALGQNIKLPAGIAPEELAAAREANRVPPAERPPLPEGALSRVQTLEKGVFDNPTTKALTHEAANSEIFRKLVTDADFMRGAPEQSAILAEAVKRGALSEDTILGIADRHGLPWEEAVDTIAGALKQTASHRGTGLNAFTEGVELAQRELLARAVAGDRAAIEYIRAVERVAETARKSNLSKAANLARGVEQASLTAMLSHPKTAARNLEVSLFGVFPAKAASDLISGTIEFSVGLRKHEGRPMKSYYADFMGDLGAAVDAVSPAGRKYLGQLLNAVPGVKKSITQASAFDIRSGVLSDLTQYLRTHGEQGAPPKSFRDAVGLTRDILTGFNHAQEVFARKLFFDARLRGNLERIGLPWEEARSALLAPEMSEGLKIAVADAEAYALKRTFASRPESHLGRAILETYHKIPGMTFVLPPFPRFWMNQWAYILDHAPTMWFDMFSPEFKSVLMKGAEGGFQSREAGRALGQALTGSLMLSAAYQLRTSPAAGPKYYQISAGTNDKGEKEYIDLRPFQPLVTYAGLADMVKSLQEGKPLTELNLNPNEWSDLVAGIRRIGEVPAFALPDMIRSLRSDDPSTVWKAINTPIGQAFGRFFVPAKVLQDAMGVFGSEKANTLRSAEGQELIGPSLQQIPGASGILPPRLDPTTGKPEVTEHPAALFGGLTIQTRTKFDDLVARTPGVQWFELIGKHGTPEANQLVTQMIGRILGRKSTPDSPSIGDLYAAKIESMQLGPSAQRFVIETLMGAIRDGAVAEAQKLNPGAFAKGYIRRQRIPSAAKDVILQNLADAIHSKSIQPTPSPPK